LQLAHCTQPKYQYISQFPSRTLLVITSVIFILKSLERKRYAYLISTEIPYLFVTCALRAAQLSLFLGCARHAGHILAHSAVLLHSPCTRFQWLNQLYSSRTNTVRPYNFYKNTLLICSLHASHAAQIPVYFTVLLAHAFSYYISCIYLERTQYASLISTEIPILFVTCALRAAQLSLFLGCARLTQAKY